MRCFKIIDMVYVVVREVTVSAMVKDVVPSELGVIESHDGFDETSTCTAGFDIVESE
jgi:hypothetical protein